MFGRRHRINIIQSDRCQQQQQSNSFDHLLENWNQQSESWKKVALDVCELVCKSLQITLPLLTYYGYSWEVYNEMKILSCTSLRVAINSYGLSMGLNTNVNFVYVIQYQFNSIVRCDISAMLMNRNIDLQGCNAFSLRFSSPCLAWATCYIKDCGIYLSRKSYFMSFLCEVNRRFLI